MSQVAVPHVRLDEHGVAWIDGTRVKVIEVVLDVTARGWTPEEIHKNYPHLSLGQIHAALSYYYDHQAELDADIERRYQEVQAMRAAAADSPIRAKLRERGLLP